MTGSYPHAPGFWAGDRPRIVTSRFEHADSHTLERYLATDGYSGLRKALARPAGEIHDELTTMEHRDASTDVVTGLEVGNEGLAHGLEAVCREPFDVHRSTGRR